MMIVALCHKIQCWRKVEGASCRPCGHVHAHEVLTVPDNPEINQFNSRDLVHYTMGLVMGSVVDSPLASHHYSHFLPTKLSKTESMYSC